MAVIRHVGARRFRHFGSPKQRERDTLPSVEEKPMAQDKSPSQQPEISPEDMARLLGMARPQMTLGTFIWTMLRRWVTMVVAGWAVSLVIAMVSAPLVWWGWNHGISPLLNLPSAPWWTAYALTLFVTAIAGLFRSALTVNSREE